MLNLYANTIKEMYQRPRNVVDSFVHADQSPYQQPLIFMMIGAVVLVLFTSLFIGFEVDVTGVVPEIENEQLQQLSEQILITDVIISIQLFPFMIIIFLVPVLSIAGILFLRNYTEGFYSLLILNSYLTGAIMPFLLFLIPIWAFSGLSLTDPALYTNIPGMIVGGAGLLIYKNYFNVSDFLGWIRIISAFVTGYILFVFLKGLASSVTGYMIFAIRRIAEVSGNGI